jgi:hypothetical protein
MPGWFGLDCNTAAAAAVDTHCNCSHFSDAAALQCHSHHNLLEIAEVLKRGAVFVAATVMGQCSSTAAPPLVGVEHHAHAMCCSAWAAVVDNSAVL